MLWVPQKGRTKIITNSGIVGTLNPGTSIPSNGTTLLDGTVTEVISAANNIQDSWGISLQFRNATAAPSATATEGVIDVLIGGATDDVLIDSLLCGGAPRSNNVVGCREYFFPLHIPQGKRIALRHADVRVSRSIAVVVNLYGGGVPPWRVGRKVSTLGTMINNCRGVAITPSASGAAASVTEIIASTAEAYFSFLPGFQCSVDTTMTNNSLCVGIGVGASTEDRIGTWWFTTGGDECQSGPHPSMPAFQDVPAGSRLTMLVSNSGTNDSDYDGLIYAVS